MARQKKKSGCLTKIIGLFIIFVVLGALFGGNSGEKSNDQATTTNNPSPTVKADAYQTGKTTSDPTIAPTATPGIEEITALEAAQEIAMKANGSLVTTDAVKEEDGRVVINATIGKAMDATHAIIVGCEYTLNVSKSLFDNPSVDEITFCFDTEFRDAYGNPLTERALNIVIKRETAKKINYEWMKSEIYGKQSSFLDIVDFYSVHRLLESAIQ